MLRFLTSGESHGQGLVTILEGLPAGLPIDFEAITLELRYGTRNSTAGVIPESARREQTHRFWQGWARTLELPALASDLAKRSALVIKALCYGPSGGISAAGTTSLPEHLGGVRNWDYRFCWIRDACMSAISLTRRPPLV